MKSTFVAQTFLTVPVGNVSVLVLRGRDVIRLLGSRLSVEAEMSAVKPLQTSVLLS